uniref:BACK domain-containing protein n=1 Tax=Parastrongyloides trichosuri TaxID=131310 RepID=A0A0N4ZYT6_PARTI
MSRKESKSKSPVTNKIYNKDDIVVSYDTKSKSFNVNFQKQRELSEDIERYMENNDCQSYVNIQLANCENFKISSLLFSQSSCLIERIIRERNSSNTYFVNARSFGEKQMKQILNFIKTGKLRFKMNDVSELLSIAHRFEMCSVCTILETSILTCIKSDISLLPTLLNLASDYQNLITTKTKICILEMTNFYIKEFVSNKYFLDLTPEALIMFLTSDSIKISTEMDIFRMAVIYMDHHEVYGFADSLFNCIRFNFCSDRLLEDMKSDLDKIDKKYLNFSFDAYCNDKDKNVQSYGNSTSEFMLPKNLNNFINRNSNDKNALNVSDILKKQFEGIITKTVDKKNKRNLLAPDSIGNDIKGSIKQKKFKLMPTISNHLKEFNKNKDRIHNRYDEGDEMSENITTNPYKLLPDFKDRLFSSESVYEINKIGGVSKNVMQHNGETIINGENGNSDIERNPYYFALKNREYRRFTADSIRSINAIDSKIFDNKSIDLSNDYKKPFKSNFTSPNIKEYLPDIHAPN